MDGLTSCTESLGFESSDERQPEGSGGGGGEEEEEEEACPSRAPARPEKAWKVASTAEETTKRSERTYPPPLTSMRRDGQRSFILRPVRRDGRLELTEVRIGRPPEILQASREGGRLRLRLIVRDQQEEEEAEDDEALNLDTTTSESEIQWYSKKEDEEQEINNRESEEEKGDDDGAWVLRRCNEEAGAAVGHDNQHHHQGRQPHKVHVWRQQHCVV